MVQKLEDAKTMLQKDRKTKFIIIAVVVMILLALLLFGNDRYRAPRAEVKAPKITTAEREHLDDFVAAFSTDLDNLKRDQAESKKEMQELGTRLDVYERRTSDIFKKILEKISDIETNLSEPGTDGANTGVIDDGMMVETDENMEQEETDQLESFFDGKEPVAEKEEPAPKKVAFVAPGDTVRVRLLGGVNAPTDGTPYPVIFKLLSHVSGPDNSQLPLGEARLIAAAQGSIVDQRALFRLTKLSIRLPNGERKVVSVDGWIVGEDGIRGLKGILIDPIGKAIAGGVMVGGLQGFGEAIKDANSETLDTYYGTRKIVNGDTAEYALGSGLSKGADVWADILKDRLKEMVPVVQVLSGREATATFSNEVTIDSLYDQLEQGTDDQFSNVD